MAGITLSRRKQEAREPVQDFYRSLTQLAARAGFSENDGIVTAQFVHGLYHEDVQLAVQRIYMTDRTNIQKLLEVAVQEEFVRNYVNRKSKETVYVRQIIKEKERKPDLKPINPPRNINQSTPFCVYCRVYGHYVKYCTVRLSHNCTYCKRNGHLWKNCFKRQIKEKYQENDRRQRWLKTNEEQKAPRKQKDEKYDTEIMRNEENW